MSESDASAHESKQLLHLVFGGELKALDSFEFRDPTKIDIVSRDSGRSWSRAV